MSGNFDFPPASVDPHSAFESSTIDPRVTSRNSLIQGATSHPNERDGEFGRRRRIIDAEIRRYINSGGSTRRQLHEDQAAANQDFPTSAIRPRAIGSRLRRRATAGYTSPHRGSMQYESTALGLNSLEPSLPRIGALDMASAEYSGEAEVNRRRKRPRLSEDNMGLPFRRFHYEWNGRARPGHLKMEIHECDGGLHAEAAATDRRHYNQENILRNDKSVYCTESNRCNITLRHVEEACFSLTKIVIKAPEKGFTAPIQEGLIFVGMNADELTLRASKYHFAANTKLELESDDESAAPSSPTSENRPVSRRRDSTSRTVPPPISDRTIRMSSVSLRVLEAATSDTITNPFYRDDSFREQPQVPSGETASEEDEHLIRDHGFKVTAHCNEPSDDEEEESSPETLADRYQREHMPSTLLLPGDDDADYANAASARFYRHTAAQAELCRRREKKRDSPSLIEVSNEGTTSKNTPTPHARFFIEKNKSVVSMSFDPPAAGKYILLKLFGPNENQNIDIQSINIYGYAGPRIFPATELS